MLSEQERLERRSQIGASEIYKLLNFDTQQAQDLFDLKMGLKEHVELDNDAITAGNILEEDCLDYYENSNNCELLRNERIEHPKIKGLVVSLDAREKATSIPVENKVIKEDVWLSWHAKRSYNALYEDIKLNIPKAYYCQLQIQIATLGVEIGKLNVNTLTQEEQENPIEVVITEIHNKQVIIYRDDELIEELEKRAKYMLHCIKYKRRPSENDYLEKYIY